MTYRSFEEQEKYNVAAMGPKLGRLYTFLWQETAQLFLSFREYVDLFGKSPEQVDLLNRVASGFFHHIQDIMWDSLILGISRITDAPSQTSRKWKNMSICHAIELVDNESLKEKLINCSAEISKMSSFCRQYRNKRVAHFDFATYLDKNATQLSRGTRKQIFAILKKIEEYLNLIDDYYLNSSSSFEHFSQLEGASLLVEKLGELPQFRSEESA